MRKSHSRGGATVDILENRRLLTVSTVVHQETVVIGTGGEYGVTFTASSGRYTGISVGAATATIVFSGLGIPHTVKGHTYFQRGVIETVDSITLTNAVPHAALIGIRGAFGTGSFDVGSISGGHLRSIVAPDVNLTGSLNTASLGNLILNSVSGAAINLGSVSTNVKISGAMSGSFTVGRLGTLSAKELMNEKITTTAPFATSLLEIRAINIRMGIKDSEIISAGDIGNVRAKFMDGSVISAASDLTDAPLGQFPVSLVPEVSSVFTALASIGSVQIVHSAGAGYFNNSVIAAERIVIAHLGQMGAGGGGIASHHYGVFSVTAPAGSVDLASLHLNTSQLRSSAHLAALLTARGLAHQVGVLGADNVTVFGLNLNVLK